MSSKPRGNPLCPTTALELVGWTVLGPVTRLTTLKTSGWIGILYHSISSRALRRRLWTIFSPVPSIATFETGRRDWIVNFVGWTIHFWISLRAVWWIWEASIGHVVVTPFEEPTTSLRTVNNTLAAINIMNTLYLGYLPSIPRKRKEKKEKTNKQTKEKLETGKLATLFFLWICSKYT